MYIEFGPVSDGKVTRFQWALKIGKGKVVAASPTYSQRGIARRKALAVYKKLEGCNAVYEVPELKP